MKIEFAGLLLFVTFYSHTFAQHPGSQRVNELRSTNPFYIDFKGSFSISDHGAAVYNIPLFTTPGVAGTVPNVSITYNSNNSSSLLGEGWGISGASLIGRAPCTFTNDGMSDPVDFDDNDKLHLDGQRLIIVDNTAEYGGINTEYRTEQHSDKKIVIGQGGNSIDDIKNFTVFSKDGLRYYYGEFESTVTDGIVTTPVLTKRGSDAKVPMLWLLKKIQDLNGNWILFSYNLTGNSYTPREISWGAQGSSSRIGYIQFDSYETGWEKIKYIHGEKTNLNRLVRSINSYYVDPAGTPRLVRRYEIKYRHDTLSRKSFIQNIVEYPSTSTSDRNNAAENALRFTYARNKTETFASIQQTKEVLELEEDYKLAFGDFNNDGFPDRIYCKNLATELKIYLSPNNRKGTFGNTQLFTLQNAIPLGAKFFSADFNANGTTDLLYTYYIGDDLYCIFLIPQVENNTVAGFDATTPARISSFPGVDHSRIRIQTGDFNGDGTIDLLTTYFEGNDFKYTAATLSPQLKIAVSPQQTLNSVFNFSESLRTEDIAFFFNDLNGDGNNDLLFSHTDRNGWYLKSFIFNSGGSILSSAKSSEVQQITRRNLYTELFAEELDPVSQQLTTIDVTIANGDYSSLRNCIVTDINKDGNADIIISNTGKNGWDCYVAIGKGDGSFDFKQKKTITTIAFPYNYRTGFGDFNGDGNLDIVVQNSDDKGWHKLIALGSGNGEFKLRKSTETVSTIATNNFAYKVRFKILNLLCFDPFLDARNIYREILTRLGEPPLPTYENTTEIGMALDDNFHFLNALRRYRFVETGFFPNRVNTAQFSVQLGGSQCFEGLYPKSLNPENNLKRMGERLREASGSVTFQTARRNGSTTTIHTITTGEYSHYNYIDYWLPFVMDLNGDGISDLLLTYPIQPETDISVPNELNKSLTTFYSINTNEKQDLLTQVDESNYKRITISYGSTLLDSRYQGTGLKLTYPRIDLRTSYYTVKRVGASNGIRRTSLSFTNYYYWNGIWDLSGRGFLGFHSSVAENAVSKSYTFKIFDTSYAYINQGILPIKEIRTYIKATQLPVHEKLFDYHLEFPTGKNYWNFYSAGIEIVARDLNGDVMRHEKSTYTHDANGNVATATSQTGIGTVHHSLKKVINQYADDQPGFATNYISGRLTHTIIQFYKPDSAPVIKETSFDYSSVNGQLTKEIMYGEDHPLGTIKEYFYNNYGNIDSSRVYPTRKLELAKRKITHYSSDQRFVTKTVDAEGYTSEKIYDPVQGTLQQEIGADENDKTTFKTDPLGRFQEIKTRSQTSIHKEIRICRNCGVASAATFIISENSVNKIPEITYLDNNGRKVRTEMYDFKNRRIFHDFEYDREGNLTRISSPYFSNDRPVWTTYTYDALNRQIEINLPNRSSIKHLYAGLTETVIDQKNRTISNKKNTLGQLDESIDAAGYKINYEYDLFGQLIKVYDSKGVKMRYGYDISGNRTQYWNVNFHGEIIATYDCYGRKTKETDPDGNEKRYYYDRLDRLIGIAASRRGGQHLDSIAYVYNPAILPAGMHGRKQLNRIESFSDDHPIEESFIYGETGMVTQHIYKKTGRLVDQSVAQNNIFKFEFAYEGDLLKSVHYPYNPGIRIGGRQADKNVFVHYDYSYGTLIRADLNINNRTVSAIWELKDLTAGGRVSDFRLGNGVTGSLRYSAETNELLSIKNMFANTIISGSEYVYDVLGNMESRTSKVNTSLIETFTYDNSDRLASVNTNGYEVRLSYDEDGDILSKAYGNDFALRFAYQNNSNKYQAISVHRNGNQFREERLHQAYDALGNLKLNVDMVHPSTGTRIVYNQFNLPAAIGDKDFYYSAGGEKIMQFDQSGRSASINLGGMSTINYKKSGGSYGFQQQVYNIQINGETVAFVSSSDEKLYYLHKDIFGNVTEISDGQGAIKIKVAFDVWGMKRNPDTWAYQFQHNFANTYTRGYLDQHYFDDYKLADLHNRMYDPMSGRFLSVDKLNNNRLSNTQYINSYAYGYNNHTKFQDPNGTFPWLILAAAAYLGASYTGGSLAPWEWNENWWKGAIVGAAAVAGGYYMAAAVPASAPATTAGFAGGFGAGFASGFSNTLVNGGNFGSALTSGLYGGIVGGVTGAFTAGIGHEIPVFRNPEAFSTSSLLKAASHGVVQGFSSELMGGNFEHGFLAGSVAELGQPLNSANTFGSQGQVVVAGLIGGTASALGGGKFANGAISGSFVQMYNHNLFQQQIDDSYGKIVSAKYYARYFLDEREAVILTKDEFELAIRSNPTYSKCSLISGNYVSGIYRCLAESPVLSPSWGWLGSYTMFLDQNFKPIGLFDTYNFDWWKSNQNIIRFIPTYTGWFIKAQWGHGNPDRGYGIFYWEGLQK